MAGLTRIYRRGTGEINLYCPASGLLEMRGTGDRINLSQFVTLRVLLGF